MTPTITVSQTGGVTLTVAYQTNVPSFTGTTGSTDNAILRASGTSGTVIQGSLPTIADDGTLDAPAITINGDPVAPKETERTIFIPLSQIFGTGTHQAEPLDYSPGLGFMYKVLRFPNSAQTHYAEFDLFFPPDADTTAPLEITFYWRSPGYPSATGAIDFRLRAEPFTFDESPDVSLTYTVLPSSSSADGYTRSTTFLVEFGEANPAFWRFQLFRVGADGFTGDAYLLSAYLTYQTL
jgi:hypothetical protein